MSYLFLVIKLNTKAQKKCKSLNQVKVNSNLHYFL
jgi:hypothetical protein